MQVKVDLHTHVDLHENRDDLITFFKMAESENVKKLAFLEHNCLKYIKPLQEIMAESGGILKVDENLFNDIAYDCKQNTKTNKEINFTK